MRMRSRLVSSITTLFALAVITTGATFASLQSTSVALTGNQINTSAGLAISTNGVNFPQTISGFNFTGVVPGGDPYPANGNTFYIKNTGVANLAIKAAISTPPSNPSGVNLSKVYLIFTRVDNNTQTSLSVQSLVNSYAGGASTGGLSLNDSIAAGTIAQYKLQVSMDTDAFNGSSASITGIDLWFIGIGS